MRPQPLATSGKRRTPSSATNTCGLSVHHPAPTQNSSTIPKALVLLALFGTTEVVP